MKRFAFIFPGQGSQFVGMLSDLADKHPEIKETFKEASVELNYDLWTLIQNGPAIELNKTHQAQPALLTASVALWRVWKKKKNRNPALMAGHSLGEYSALVCANTISFKDAVRLVEMRGKFMQEAMLEEEGAMSAIICLNEGTISEICKKITNCQIVAPASYNSPNQVVIAGHKDAVKRACIACKAAGAKYTIPLPVTVPSHCALMKSAAEKLADELKKITFNTPIIPVINNVDVKCETSKEAICNALVRQLYNPVQWTKIIEYIISQGINHLYEVGPGKILTRLAKHVVDCLTISNVIKLDVLSATFL